MKQCCLYHLQRFQLLMSGKRQASYSIDPNTLEQKQKDSEGQIQGTNNQTKTQKAQRKIFKIKRGNQSHTSEQKESKISFKLNQSQQIKSNDSTKNQNADSKALNQKDSKNGKSQAGPVNPFQNLFKSDNKIFNGIGIFTNANSTNLFTANKGTQQTSKAISNGSIGSGTASIFKTNGPSIFNNSIKNTSSSLFTKQAPVQNNDDQGSGDSAQLQQAQKLNGDPSKSKTNFNYENNCPVLLTLKVLKFKKTGGQLIQNVQLVLQKQKQTNIKYITIRLPATKKSIFSGILLDGKSQFKHINGKKQNVEVFAFYKQKQSFGKSLLKFHFQKQQDGQKLYERLEQLLNSQKSKQGQKDDKAEQKK